MSTHAHAVTLLGRPLAGSDAYTVERLVTTRNQLRAALADTRNAGTALLLPFAPQEERSVILLVAAVLGALPRGGDGRMVVESPLENPFAQEGAAGGAVAVLHHAPRILGIGRHVEELTNAGKTVLLTGIAAELERLDLRVPYRWAHPEGPSNPLGAAPQEVGIGALASLAPWVAAAELWSVPLPLDLLTELAGLHEDAAAAAIEGCASTGPLLWVETRHPPALLVATGGERFAEGILTGLGLKGVALWKLSERIIAGASADAPAHRHAVLRLVRGWFLSPAKRRGWFGPAAPLATLRALLVAHGARLAEAAALGERLAWAGLFADMGLFAQADAQLQTAAAKGSADERLLHARAHTLGRWALVSPPKAEEARLAFRALAQADDANPYVWQAWGVLEQRLGNYRGARNLLDTAVRTAPTNVVCLVARADLALDEGSFGEADDLLRRAAAVDPASAFVLHLQGRLLHARGDDQRAAERFAALLVQEPLSVHARHGLATLAADAGRWDEAEGQLSVALAVDPENVAALHARADVARRWAEELLAGSDPVGAEEHLRRSQQVLHQALACEPGNPRLHLGLALVALGLGRCCQAQGSDAGALFAEAGDTLRRLLAERPDSLQALHALGAVAAATGDLQEAARCYQAVVARQKDNLHALVSLAELARQTGLPDEAARHLAAARVALVGWRSRLPTHELTRWQARLAALEQTT